VGHALRVQLPPYENPRNAWRRLIHKEVVKAARASQTQFSREDRFKVSIQLHMSQRMLGFHDVDNRLKDILDALQGRMGGKSRVGKSLIHNDSQIIAVTISKVLVQDRSRAGGILTIVKIGARSRWHQVKSL
jgi:Holliday junction resolvase RusA-like endonuclease